MLRGLPICGGDSAWSSRTSRSSSGSVATPELRAAVEGWLTGATVPAEGASEADWIEWEQRKHERLLAA